MQNKDFFIRCDCGEEGLMLRNFMTLLFIIATISIGFSYGVAFQADTISIWSYRIPLIIGMICMFILIFYNTSKK